MAPAAGVLHNPILSETTVAWNMNSRLSLFIRSIMWIFSIQGIGNNMDPMKMDLSRIQEEGSRGIRSATIFLKLPFAIICNKHRQNNTSLGPNRTKAQTWTHKIQPHGMEEPDTTKGALKCHLCMPAEFAVRTQIPLHGNNGGGWWQKTAARGHLETLLPGTLLLPARALASPCHASRSNNCINPASS